MSIDVNAVVGKEMASIPFSWEHRDTILYALGVGIGVGVSPVDENVLRYTYENENLRVLPSFGVVPAFPALTGIFGVPGFDINPMMILHGEQYTEILCDQIPTKADTTTTSRVQAVYDKGKGALAVLEAVTTTTDGQDLFKNVFGIFIRGEGGFGGESGPPPGNDRPERAPDHTLEYPTMTHQAILYRLSGDYNPLHIDPDFAALGGFDRPILHGMCTYGNCARGAIDAVCGGDPNRLRSIKARFATPVMPGETIIVDLWKESDTKYILGARVKERGVDVVKNAAVVIR
ncbi:MAG: acyl dehydratase [Hyphomicrobiaceae bacterium]|jgi:acyl dehydratase